MWRIAAVAMLLVLAGSLAWNGLQLREESALRLDPFELHAYGDWRPLDPPSPHLDRVVFFGDSRARSWEQPRLDGYELVNRGIGYQTTAQILGRVESDVIALSPRVVVIQAGINDLKALRFFPQRREPIIEGCVSNLIAIAKRCRAAGVGVVMMSIFSVARTWHSLWLGGVFEPTVATVEQANARLRRRLPAGVALFDAGALLNAPDGTVQPRFARDSLHLAESGYSVLLAALRPVLDELTR